MQILLPPKRWMQEAACMKVLCKRVCSKVAVILMNSIRKPIKSNITKKEKEAVESLRKDKDIKTSWLIKANV